MRTEHTKLCDYPCGWPKRSHGRWSRCYYGANARVYDRTVERRETVRDVLGEIYEYDQISPPTAVDDADG